MTTKPTNTKPWQFGLRSLLGFVLLICLVSSWAGYRHTRTKTIRRARTEIAILGGTCGKHCGYSPVYQVRFHGSELTDQQLDGLTRHLKRLPLAFVDVSNCRVTEAGAARLSGNVDCSVMRQTEAGEYPSAIFRHAILVSTGPR